MDFGLDIKTLLFFLPAIVIPFVSAMIGWTTNYIAIKMLFHPHLPKKILFMKIQGLIPKRHHDLAIAIAEAVEKDFFTKDSLKSLIGTVDFAPLVTNFIMQKWDEKVDKITSANPMIKMFLPPEQIDEMKEKIASSFAKNISDESDNLASAIADNADIASIIRENILKFDYMQLEEVVERLAKNEFRYIERLGGLLGFLIGVLQVLFYYHATIIDLLNL